MAITATTTTIYDVFILSTINGQRGILDFSIQFDVHLGWILPLLAS
jgi:hypothetical protein